MHIYAPCRPAVQEDDTEIYASCRPVVQEDDTQIYTSCRPLVQEGNTQILYNACTTASYATLYFVECRGDKIPIGVYIIISPGHLRQQPGGPGARLQDVATLSSLSGEESTCSYILEFLTCRAPCCRPAGSRTRSLLSTAQ